MAKKRYYAVVSGRRTGIFNSWDDCKDFVTGYPNAKYKGFCTLKEAATMKKWSKSISIHFTKVAAHTNVEYNERADQLAKAALKNI